MKIGYLQTSPVNGDVAGNLERARDRLAASGDADLWVLPELFSTGYLHESRDVVAGLAEQENGPTLTWAKRMSSETGAALCGGAILKDHRGVYNGAFLVDGGKLVALYAKVHLFDREKLVFDPGPGPLRAHDLRGTRVGLLICYDWRFPEAARCLALDGARILLHPSNLVLPWAQDAMRTRCVENGVFAVTANRVGSEQDLTFTGGSQIAGPRGETLAHGPEDGEHAAVVEIDPDRARSKAINERNDLFGDRRPDLYRRLTTP